VTISRKKKFVNVSLAQATPLLNGDGDVVFVSVVSGTLIATGREDGVRVSVHSYALAHGDVRAVNCAPGAAEAFIPHRNALMIEGGPGAQPDTSVEDMQP